MDCLILAAGKGNRFYETSGVPSAEQKAAKVDETLLGVPLIQYVVDRALEVSRGADCHRIIVAVLDDEAGQEVEDTLRGYSRNRSHFQAGTIEIFRVPQLNRRGTGATVHAVLESKGLTRGDLLILLGDVPLISVSDLKTVLRAYRIHQQQSAGAILAVERPDPGEYGRLVLGDLVGHEPDRRLWLLRRIVEHKQVPMCDETTRVALTNLVNVGAFVFDVAKVRAALTELMRRPGGSLPQTPGETEWYLTEVAEILSDDGSPLLACETNDDWGTIGFNRIKYVKKMRLLADLHDFYAAFTDFEHLVRVRRGMESWLKQRLHQ